LKIAILPLDYHPRPVEQILLTERPEVCHVLGFKEGMEYIAEDLGYGETNEEVLQDAGRRIGCLLEVHKCNHLSPKSVYKKVNKILENISLSDELVVNYSAGSRVMSMILCMMAVQRSLHMKVRILYSARTSEGEEKVLDHTDELMKIFKKIREMVPEEPGPEEYEISDYEDEEEEE